MGSGMRLQFLSNESEEDEGIGHAGIENYRAKPYAGAAREVGQNSRDVAVSLPVRLTFDLLDIPLEEVPDNGRLVATVNRCLEEALRENREKEKAFFAQAQKILAAGRIKVLRISDFNTTGARGPATTKGTPFYSLTRANGVSTKDREDSGGSFGIGKNAAFAISDLRTVFYSTVYSDEVTGSEKFLALGKSILVSHHDERGRPLRQIGYWGLPDFRAIDDRSVLPDWLHREERGTSVFVFGFREEPDWQHRISCALIESFFPAVHEGQMEFAVDDGKIFIGRETLAPLFEAEEVLQAAEANGHRAEFEIARHHYRCLISPDAKNHDVFIPSLGKVRIRVFVQQELPKKICITRNGLVITDSLKNFGQPFDKFPLYQDFVAVITPLEAEGSSFIKKLEDPKHEELSPEGLPDEASRDHAKDVIRKLGTKIRDAIKKDSFIQYASEVAADEMRDYFAAESESSRENRTSPDDDPETIRYAVEPRRPRHHPRAIIDGGENTSEFEIGPAPGPGPHPGPGPQPGPRPGPGPGPEPEPGPQPDGPDRSRPIRPVRLLDVRNILPPGSPLNARTIFLTPDAGGMLNMRIEAVGVNNNEPLTIVSASGANVSQGLISIPVEAGQRRQIDVIFSEAYDGPVEIRASLTAAQETAA
ncbi:hypothetical protein NKJ36_25055 [Mesorhizobium sp. M0142]|uniref:hypothetical protein n=1 Tax=unclassified Mesorhizobium TaxID=325217 RepID=UPI00333B60BA